MKLRTASLHSSQSHNLFCSRFAAWQLVMEEAVSSNDEPRGRDRETYRSSVRTPLASTHRRNTENSLQKWYNRPSLLTSAERSLLLSSCLNFFCSKQHGTTTLSHLRRKSRRLGTQTPSFSWRRHGCRTTALGRPLPKLTYTRGEYMPAPGSRSSNARRLPPRCRVPRRLPALDVPK